MTGTVIGASLAAALVARCTEMALLSNETIVAVPGAGERFSSRDC